MFIIGKKGVVVTDKHTISYGLIRYIAQYKLPIILIYFDDLSICRFSKSVKKSIKLNCTDNKSMIEQLISLSKKLDLSNYLLIPCDDDKLALFSKYKEKLSQHFIPICSDWEKVKKFIDKAMTYRLCESLGISYPKTYTEYDKITDILDEIKYPVIIKPNEMYSFFNRFKKKALLCRNHKELLEKYHEYKGENYSLMVQEFIEEGSNALYSYVGYALNGEILEGLIVHRKRQHPMIFGTASTYVLVKEIPKLKKIGKFLVKKTKYSGPFEIEFMYDKKVKDYKLLEVNARFWGWHTIMPAYGLNIIEKMISYYLGDIKLNTEINNKNIKKCWTHLITDLYIIFKEGLKNNLNIGESIKSIKKCEYAVFNKDDVFPFFWEIISSPINYLKRNR